MIFSCDGRIAVLCDGHCDKAWGRNSRPIFGEEGGREEFLADGELGVAPVDPETYEGGQAKPTDYDDPARHNKWCARECERSEFIYPIMPSREIELPDFSRRVEL